MPSTPSHGVARGDYAVASDHLRFFYMPYVPTSAKPKLRVVVVGAVVVVVVASWLLAGRPRQWSRRPRGGFPSSSCRCRRQRRRCRLLSRLRHRH